MTNSERIEALIRHYGLSVKRFAESIGLKSPQNLYDIQNGKIKSISNYLADKITTRYPEISLNWLLEGEGEMIFEEGNVAADAKNRTWLLPMSAVGGSLSGFAAEGVGLANCEAVISPIDNVDFAISVFGESMAPEYPSGSRVLIKKINPNTFIDWGRVYVLDTSNGVIIKEVHLCPEDQECIICHSNNPDPKFQPFKINKNEIYGMYRVLMCMAPK